MSDPVWVSLFSGGKDSAYALHAAQASGRRVARLVTVHPPEGSFFYHVPGTELAELAATSIGIPLTSIRLGSRVGGPDMTAGERGDEELEPLEATLEDLKADLHTLRGVTTGAVASRYQRDRLEALASRLGLDLYAPLWNEDPHRSAQAMIDAGFEITIVQVAAEGLDESWLGRHIDDTALAELRELEERYGVHPLGEGGEYETIVTDGPHMKRPIEFEYETRWDGARGNLVFTDAWLS